MDYMIADMHFGDAQIIKYENRPFKNIEEMDQSIIDNWNHTVGLDDTVFILGDISNYDIDKTSRIINELNGHKYLIMGNHDRHLTPNDYRNMGFEEASAYPILYKGFYILSHEPIYLNENMPYANLYGHVHGNKTYQSVTRQSMCLCVERIDYTPISFEEIVAKMRNCNKF